MCVVQPDFLIGQDFLNLRDFPEAILRHHCLNNIYLKKVSKLHSLNCFKVAIQQRALFSCLWAAERSTLSSKFLEKVIFSPHQCFLINIDCSPFGSKVVLHLSEGPAYHVHKKATHNRCGTAHSCVTVNIYCVTILQQPVEQKNRLR